MAFTEFCCRSGGSNLNAGTRTGNSTEPGTSADFTYASGNWVQSTGVFTVASGNPSSDGVAVGDFASVYADGSTSTGFVGRVTARDATTITVSLSAKAGTAPTDGTGNRTLKIGGAWKGPNGTDGFPFTVITSTLNNSSNNEPRVNFKNDAQYAITAAITAATANDVTYQGYTSTYDDGGVAVIDGGATGASYILVTFAGAPQVNYITFQNNGNSGSANLVGGSVNFFRCQFLNSRGAGAGTTGRCVECLAYNCNASNTSNIGGFSRTSGNLECIRCVSHGHSAGSNSHGYVVDRALFCIAANNAGAGFLQVSSAGFVTLINCDIYNNTGNGIDTSSNNGVYIYVDNCNLVKNGAFGIRNIGTGTGSGIYINCAFGSGTQANTSGQTSFSNDRSIYTTGSITYAADVTPWVDPANGDFRINRDTATGTGRGLFNQNAGFTGTVGYPDVGAGQRTVDELTTTTGQSVVDGILNGMQVKKNTALSNFTFFLRSSVGAAVTGATVTATRSIDGAAFASCANAVSEIANGWYKINLAAADLNGTVIALNFAASGALTVTQTILTQAA